MRTTPLVAAILTPALLLSTLAGCAQSTNTQTSSGSATSWSTATRAGAWRPNTNAPDIERFTKLRAPGGALLSPDGRLFVRDLPDGITQVYSASRIPADKGATYNKLTSFPDGATGATLAPDGSVLIVSHAMGGNEQNQFSLVWPGAGSANPIGPMPLLANPKVQFGLNLWTRDRAGVVFTANEESPNDFHLYRIDLPAPGQAVNAATRVKLLARPGSWSAADQSTDGTRYLVAEYRAISDSDIHELNASTGELTKLNPTDGKQSAGWVGYLPGEQSALFTSDHEDGIRRLFVRNFADKSISKPIPALDAFEIDGAEISRDKQFLAVIINRDGYGDLRLFKLPTFEPITLPTIEEGTIGGVSFVPSSHHPEVTTLTYTLSNPRNPGLSYALDLVNGAVRGEPRALTGVIDDQGIDLASLALPQLVKIKSFDGVEIPAFVYLPPGHTKDKGPIPFIVDYHGGPEGQHRPSFDRNVQYYVSRGYGYVEPNVRGSTGYGRAFHMLDDYKKRWDSVKDGVAVARWLVDNGYSRNGWVAATGGSYGGYMANAVIVEDTKQVEAGLAKANVFGASITRVGIVNVRTFLERTSGYRRKLREAEYGPLSDPDFLESVSPLNMVDKVRCPVMIAHGFNDPRVPIYEAMLYAVALQQRGMNPETLYFPDEGHGFAKLPNRLLHARRSADFLDRTIGANAQK